MNAFLPQRLPDLPKIECAAEDSAELLIVQIQAADTTTFQFRAHWSIGIVESEANYLISAAFEFQGEIDANSFGSAKLKGEKALCNYGNFGLNLRFQVSTNLRARQPARPLWQDYPKQRRVQAR